MNQLDSWHGLREWTDARIACGRAGTALPTQAVLDFQLDHARARDAVGMDCDFSPIIAWTAQQNLACLQLTSQATSRPEYLRRPDLGRLLAPPSQRTLTAWREEHGNCGLCIVVADGLSALAIKRQALALLQTLLPLLPPVAKPLAPIICASQARVGLSDEIGQALGAQAILMLVGERPGLSSPDSLGLYFTWDPRTGRQNAERNCISNVRPGGLDFPSAAQRAAHLITAMFRHSLSGISLKVDLPRQL